jgi:nucleoside-diphosphate-sugar epimerase
MVRILVLGGTLFVGRGIVNRLLADEHEIAVLNRGTQQLWDSRIRQLTADRTDPEQVRAALTDRYDAVVDVSGLEPVHIENVLPVLRDTPYVYIGSAAVYTRSVASPPFDENDRSDGDPIWGDYGVAKATCEKLLREACKTVTILRPPYIYGPHNTEPREQFMWARILGHQPIFVPGSGNTEIQFIHIDDLATIVVAAIAGSLSPDAYNVGESRFYSYNEWIDVCGDIAGVEPNVVHIEDPTVNARSYFPFRDEDVTLHTGRIDATGVVAPRPLRDGLTDTFAWFREFAGFPDEPTAQEKAWR